jgi:predicted glycosyltransferase
MRNIPVLPPLPSRLFFKSKSQISREISMTRVLVYSHDTFGLGNIRRMVRISEALVAYDPNVSVLIITGSPMLQAFRLPPRIDYVKLPCLARDVKGVYGVKHLDMAFDDAVRMRSSLILSAAADFNPDIVIVDKKPMGVGGELEAMLELFAHRESPPAIHLLLRDILDTPEATRRVWEGQNYHAAIARHYKSVMVVGDKQIFDVADSYAFPAETREKLVYCGYINRANLEYRGVEPSGRPRILVHAGGGQDGPQLIEAMIGALQLAGPDRGFDCRIIGGSELGEDDRCCLSTAARSIEGVDWLDFTDMMGREISTANLVIAMGGYNSVCEILSYRKRAIIVPRSVPVREQRIRAEAMDALGLIRMIPIERLSAERLLREALSELSMGNVVNSRVARICFSGLDVICHRLLGSPTAPALKMADAL